MKIDFYQKEEKKKKVGERWFTDLEVRERGQKEMDERTMSMNCVQLPWNFRFFILVIRTAMKYFVYAEQYNVF